MTTNAERIAAMAEFKRRHPKRESQHQRDMDGIAVAVATMLVVVAAIAIAFAITAGLFSHASEGPYRSVSDVIADCEANGKVAHVDHDAKRVLTVHCDVR